MCVWVRREEDGWGQDGWIASLTQWTWIWPYSDKPGALQSMGHKESDMT